MKESKTQIDNSIILSDGFQSEQNTRNIGGTPNDIVYKNGVGTFNGTSSKILFASKNYGTKISYRTKFKADGTGYRRLFQIGSNLFSLLVEGTTNSLRFIYNSNSPVTILLTLLPVEYDVFITYDGVNLRTYIDGALRTTTAFSPIEIDGILAIGSLITSNQYFCGEMDLAQIYNRALSTKEVSNLYNNLTYKNISSKDEVLSIDAYQGVIQDKYENVITNTDVVVKRDNSNVMYFDGDTSKLAIGNVGNIKSISFWINPYTITEQILEGAANDKLIHISSWTLTYPDFDDAFIDKVNSNTLVANKWQCITINSSTDVDMS